MSIIILFWCTNDALINNIRESYKVCSLSKEASEHFFKLTTEALQHHDKAIYKGYHGAALAVKASFAWNPIMKLSYFNKSKKIIEESIKLEPTNIELRMIRLSIQSNAPRIAGYYKNIEEDRDFMLSHINKTTNSDLKKYIQGFIDHSDVFSKP